ncbi:MAG TPA: tetratricopeptide repeat protein, partial [Elusimicrobiota bacterium]|nr:tetratricopeptide repeat protein [Elusimicrobiota bacterium]
MTSARPVATVAWVLAFLAMAGGARAETAAELCKQEFDGYKQKLAKTPEDNQLWTEFRACVIELKRWNDGADIGADAIKSHPELWQPHLLIGIAHFHMKEYQQAVDEFKEATRLKSDEPLPHYYLGMSYLFLKRPEDAAPAAEQAVTLDPNNPMNYRQLAYAYLLLDQNDKCEATAKKAISLDNNDVAAWKSLGNL